MSERLVFGYGTAGRRREAPGHSVQPVTQKLPAASTPPVRTRDANPGRAEERRDWAFLGLLAFTALLFFRPQDQIHVMEALHLAEIAALVALASMVSGRLRRGLLFTRLTPELVGVVALGAIILATAPFSIWRGGAVATFTTLYLKVVLIFLLLVNTLSSPKRLERVVWLIVVATSYIALRAVLDYVRGTNLVESGRVQGAVGGMFKNPNDLALNMVAVLPLAVSMAIRRGAVVRRIGAALGGLLMLGAVVASHSRSGFVGLAIMTMMLAGHLLRRRPGLVVAAVMAGVLALPLLPASYWHRLSSITDDSQDETGSRAARERLLRDALGVFVTHPFTGVGAGQFKNYNPEGREEAWRETHNVLLQVGAELGVFGLAVFVFLIGRGLYARRQVRRLLRRAEASAPGSLEPAETDYLIAHAATLSAAMAGWLACALFASVAYNWTFYYLLALAAAPREILLDRLGQPAREPARQGLRQPLRPRPGQALRRVEVRA